MARDPGAHGAADVGTTGRPLAEDEDEYQHPVLLRLRSHADLGAAVRRSAAWAAGSRAASQVLQFLGLIISARLLLPSDYGNQAVVAPILAFANLFATLGTASAVVHARRVTEHLLSTAFWINALAGVLLTCLVAALSVPLSHLFRNPTLVPLLLLASLIFTINLSIVHLALLERTQRFKAIALIETGSVLLATVTIVVAAALGAGPYSLVLGPLVNQASSTVALLVVVRWRPHRRPDRESLAHLWRYSRGITGFNFLNFWSNNADNLLLARYVTLTDLGNYSRAYNLMKLPVTQSNIMMVRVLFPALSRLRDDPPRLARAWLRALSVATAVSAPVALTMAVTAPALVEVLFGRRWLGMVTVLQLLSVGAVPLTLSATAGGLLRAVGATDTLFRLGIATSFMSVGAIVAGLPWGTTGVATALMVKYYVEVSVTMRTCLRQIQLGWHELVRTLLGIWSACVVMAGAGLGVRLVLPDLPAWQVLLSQLAVVTLTYVAVLRWTDRSTLRGFLDLAARLVRRSRTA